MPGHTAKRGSNLQLNAARRKVCPHSAFWTIDFDIEKHREEWKAGEQRRAQRSVASRAESLATDRQRARLGLPAVRTPELPEAFNGWDVDAPREDVPGRFEEARGMVLAYETIFCPQYENADKDIAPWPSKHEMDYEGDGRMATDRLHRRYPALPRVGDDQTINWQHRVPIPAYPFEEFYYPIPSEVDIFMRTHNVEDVQFDDEVGRQALGTELMALLDPQDQW